MAREIWSIGLLENARTFRLFPESPVLKGDGMENIVLASSSPRRKEILKMMRIPFQVVEPNVDESSLAAESLDMLPEILAAEKVNSVLRSLPEGHDFLWILGADTLVMMDGKVYGKPKSRDEAFGFLSAFQGRTHDVVTGLALYNVRKRALSVRSAIAKVTFAPMSGDEIEWYLSTDEWKDAAGGYKIQGLAACFVTKIEGAPSCVVGLPIFTLYDMLKKEGYPLVG